MRRIPIDPKCENCQKSPEDVLHAVWNCPLIKLAWDNETWLLRIRDSQFLDHADLFSKVLEIGTQQNSEAFIIILWTLWQRRNKIRVHQAVETIDQVNTKARAYMDEFASSIESSPPKDQCPT